MTRQHIVVGDTTSVGGAVLAGHPDMSINGLAQVFTGDAVLCAVCGVTKVAAGSADFMDERGRHAAREDDPLACGHKLVSTRQHSSSEA